MELMDSLINKFPNVRECCCGCSLETGCKIIGWLQIILSGISIIPYFVILAFYSILIASLPAFGIFGIIIILISVAVNVAFFVLGVYLLLGVNRDDANKVKIWIYGHMIILCINAIIFILDIVGAILTVGLMIGPLIATAIWICVTVYCIVVVKSYYNERTRRPEV